jgi:hypothetical protein
MATDHLPEFDHLLKCFGKAIQLDVQAGIERMDAELSRLSGDPDAAATHDLRATSLEEKAEAWGNQFRKDDAAP